MLNLGKPVPKNIFIKILERVYTHPQDKKVNLNKKQLKNNCKSDYFSQHKYYLYHFVCKQHQVDIKNCLNLIPGFRQSM